MPSEISRKIVKLQKGLDLPSRAIVDGLFENFWTHCYPWDPIVERSQVVRMTYQKVSPLLLQAIFLAGSWMSSTSLSYATPPELYERAKTLFWLDYEQDRLIVLTAVSLMHWWNPHGPECVSTNTSSFWCRIAVSLAHQMDLHTQNRHVADESLRRRLWWSLVGRARRSPCRSLSLILSRLAIPSSAPLMAVPRPLISTIATLLSPPPKILPIQP